MILSKAPAPGQWRRGQRSLGAALALLLCSVSAPATPATPAPAEDPSQPRYATLRSAPVNARVGPGEDYKAVWTYKAKGIPVQVVEEAQDWRRICDPEGGLAWVRARVLDSRRTVMRMRPSDLPLRRAPADDARVGAVLAARATATLQTCERGWCKVSVDHASGWARASELWGAEDARQCR